jgi:GNAT superfamily N-acetyltransferase
MTNMTLRAACAEDEDFLLAVYASTRTDEIAPLPWTDAEKDGFLKQQGEAQHRHYRSRYQGAEYYVILRDGGPVGRLYVARWPREIRIMDVALLPAHRNAGIGSQLIAGIFEEAAAAGKTVTVHVESFNPARRLYERLGFREIEDKGMYCLLGWTPEARHA